MKELTSSELIQLADDMCLFSHVFDVNAIKDASMEKFKTIGLRCIRDLDQARGHVKSILVGQRPYLYEAKASSTDLDTIIPTQGDIHSVPLIVPPLHGDGTYRFELTDEGKRWIGLQIRLSQCFGPRFSSEQPYRHITRFLRNYTINHYAATYQSLVAGIRFIHPEFRIRGVGSSPAPSTIESRMNTHLAKFTAELRSEAFKRQIKGAQRSLNKNLASCSDYIDGLCSTYSSMQILRLDLGYRSHPGLHGPHDSAMARGSNPEEGTTPVMPRGHQLMDVMERIIQHRDALIKHINKSLKSARLGYIWRILRSAQDGYWLHLILFLDGDAGLDPDRMGKELGLAWMSITQGQGLSLSHPCVPIGQQSYRNAGVGLFVPEADGWQATRTKMLQFLVGLDRLLVLTMPGKEHAIGGGKLPKASVSGDVGQQAS